MPWTCPGPLKMRVGRAERSQEDRARQNGGRRCLARRCAPRVEHGREQTESVMGWVGLKSSEWVKLLGFKRPHCVIHMSHKPFSSL
jgi:hypothetical protein